MIRLRRLIVRCRHALLAAALLFALPLIAFWPQTVGGRTLLPAENLYQYEPYASYRGATGADSPPPEIPHNHLVSDLVLQNMQWKAFILESFGQGEFPLWNPHQLGGVPFLAAGQQSTLYPFSLITYTLPLASAYGWFSVVQLWLGGLAMWALLRGLGAGRAGALLAGVTYQLSAFFIISAVFPMIIAGAAWLPLLLLMIENIVQRRPLLRGRPAAAPWAAIGALALGLCILAGHVEIVYYTLLISAYYAACRLGWALWTSRHDRQQWAGLAGAAGWMLLMIALGLGLGAVQFLPLFELASLNFRSSSSTLAEVLSWAHPPRDLIQFALPNFYGSPAQHAYLDVFTGQTVSLAEQVIRNSAGARIVHTEWGIKNYVEAALYLGILPLVLAAFALIAPRSRPGGPPYRVIFAVLAGLSLSFMFGLPTYALLYYGLPGINQLHSPFRWIFALTLCAAVLAGFGLDALVRLATDRDAPGRRRARIAGGALIALGAGTLAALGLGRVFFSALAPLITRLLNGMVTASGAPASSVFPTPEMFFSVQAPNVLVLGVMLLLSGGVFLGLSVRRPRFPLQWQAFAALALAAAAADLLIASGGFHAASDPRWLDYHPPAIEWLRQQQGQWRYITLDDPAQRPLFQANMTLRDGLDDVRGYESIIPRQIVETLQGLAPQVQLDYNRIAPLYTAYDPALGFDVRSALESQRLDALNIRFVITHRSTDIGAVPGFRLAYEDDAVRIWENGDAYPRAMLVPGTPDAISAPGTAVARLSGTSREGVYPVTADGASTLVISENDLPGWRAYVRPPGGSEQDETEVSIARIDGSFIGVRVPPGEWTVRVVYSPASFQLGLFASFLSALALLLLAGAYAWRALLAAPAGASDDSLHRLARNSAAPILLNLFNRGIDFSFAFVMLRLLGPAEAGAYFFAGVVFVWFDIFTNFGLNLFLTREVSRDRDKARRYFFNTSAMRIGLALLGVPLLAGFLGIRQSTATPPLEPHVLLAIGILYIGLLPNSLSTGLTALFYAFERAETPAFVTTLATLCKTVGGLIVLLLGFGIVGLAAVSIVTNVITLAVLAWNGRAMLGGGRLPRPERGLMRRMAGESWPLMLNHFLATIFFQIDVVLIEAIHGGWMVGQYQIAYKWVTALNIIPAFFTQAMLPRLSRQAQDDPAALRRTYILAIKLLFSMALPFAVIFFALATPLTALLGGPAYLPDGAIATQIMIWSIPIGWMNSFGQYMLVALDLQKRIVRAFILAVGFNLISNAILIPRYGYQAAAFTTILSEAVLFVPFYWLLRAKLGPVPWLALLWRPLAAAGAMLAVLLALVSIGFGVLLATVLAGGAYAGLWLALRALDADEWARLAPLLPRRVRARLAG